MLCVHARGARGLELLLPGRWLQIFKQGQHIAIIEPYYKVYADGTQGIRVENPAEVGAGSTQACSPKMLQLRWMQAAPRATRTLQLNFGWFHDGIHQISS